jgi:SAM-dependent methyltransferase
METKQKSKPQLKSISSNFDFEAVFEVDDYVYFYGDFLTEEVTFKQVTFLVQALDLDKPCRVLDLACGYGRHANVLAALGHGVTGIDLMPGFLEIARRDAEHKGLKVDYRQGDMRRLYYQKVFDCILLIFTAFGYFEDQQNLKVLQNVYQALKPGGRFCFDIPNREAHLKHLTPCMVTEKESDLMIDRLEYDEQTSRLYNRRIVIRDGERRDKPFFLRLYDLEEIKTLLSQVGFTSLRFYSNWEAEPLSPDARRMVITAKRLE